MKRLLYAALLLMIPLHHDFWWWNDPTLVLGIMPIGLAYHALYTVVAAGLWFLMLRIAWPTELEEFAQGVEEGTLRE